MCVALACVAAESARFFNDERCASIEARRKAIACASCGCLSGLSAEDR
jgi:hypothetical protein